ncbi:MAG: TetR/AcrR family transcriptional regulator [Lachnospiraceae bacterium]|nr:TetR/AcrR family transcriptional regulator [Lachnospiraceae bacterium]
MSDEKMSAVRRRTKRIVQESFIRLLGEKPFHEITVRNLCEEADINRATFYRYYADLNALYDELSDDLFQHLFNDLATRSEQISIADRSASRNLFRDALSIMKKNRLLCLNLLDKTNGPFALRLRSSLEILITQKTGSRIPSEASLILDFISGGLVASTHSWLSSGCIVEKDVFADILYNSCMPSFQRIDTIFRKL